MPLITLMIDGRTVQAKKGSTILEAAKLVNIKISTLCFLKDINTIGACRVCVVEVEGESLLQASCTTIVEEGMVVNTQSQTVRRSRRTTVELILSDHPYRCPTCVRDKNCELQDLVQELDLDLYHTVYARPDFPFNGAMSNSSLDNSLDFLVFDPAKCVLCQRCVAVCKVNALTIKNKSFEAVIGPTDAVKRIDSCCVKCGQCLEVCPTGALQEVTVLK